MFKLKRVEPTLISFSRWTDRQTTCVKQILKHFPLTDSGLRQNFLYTGKYINIQLIWTTKDRKDNRVVWDQNDRAPISTGLSIDLFILKNMGAAIIDFRVCPPLVKCKNRMFSGFIDTLMYGFSSTGVTIYCYFGLKFNDNTCCEVICKRRYNDNKWITWYLFVFF